MTPFFPLQGFGRVGGNKESKVFSELKQRGLDNGSREWLLGAKLGHVALVLDALLRVYPAGHAFTFREAKEKLQHYGIGHRSLSSALKSAPRGQRLFIYAGVYKPAKGRPAQRYEVADAQAIARRLHLARTTSDFIPSGGLRGQAAYRAALHREFIKRKPGEHTRRFLAGRLGVSKRTTRTYDKKEQIVVTQQTWDVDLNRGSAFGLPHKTEDIQRWQWLECEGKKYPALFSMAKKLLDDKRHVVIVTQAVNKYEYRQ